MTHPEVYLVWTIRLLLCATILSDLELLSLRRLFLPKGFLDSGPSSIALLTGRTWQLEQWAVLRGILGTRLVLSVLALYCTYRLGMERVLLSLILITSLAMRRMRRTGNNASDDMLFIVQIVCTVAVYEDAAGMGIAFKFLSSQLTLSYVTAGIAKGTQAEWWTGHSVRKVLASSTFSHKYLYMILGNDLRLHRLSGRCTIIGEVLLGAAPWVPPQISLLLLGLAFTFHLGIAAIMGLNTFLPTYMSLYPAALFTSRALYSGR